MLGPQEELTKASCNIHYFCFCPTSSGSPDGEAHPGMDGSQGFLGYLSLWNESPHSLTTPPAPIMFDPSAERWQLDYFATLWLFSQSRKKAPDSTSLSCSPDRPGPQTEEGQGSELGVGVGRR